ncbi:MAG: CDF family Co(II)/Ni(II) efflux transporter DmeF [Bdellovibrio bacteriovorus]
MPSHDLSHWSHSHDFGTDAERRAERRTRAVVALTLGTMIVELVAGWLTGSMALLADGWHMGSHAAALGVAAYAYHFAHRHRADPRFSFGTGKVSSLAGYSSALLLGAGALWMLIESLSRLIDPVTIRYQDALLVAALGLLVNLVSAWLLRQSHHHGHDPHHDHAHHDHHADHHQDHNLKAAYLHVLADALTSVLALVALGLGMILGWAFLDPLMGVAGSLLIGHWALGLARSSAQVLLDAGDHEEMARRVRSTIEGEADNQVADLHLWRIGPAGYACIVSLVTHQPRPVEHYRALLAAVPALIHVTVEVNHCRAAACGAVAPAPTRAT